MQVFRLDRDSGWVAKSSAHNYLVYCFLRSSRQMLVLRPTYGHFKYTSPDTDSKQTDWEQETTPVRYLLAFPKLCGD